MLEIPCRSALLWQWQKISQNLHFVFLSERAGRGYEGVLVQRGDVAVEEDDGEELEDDDAGDEQEGQEEQRRTSAPESA